MYNVPKDLRKKFTAPQIEEHTRHFKGFADEDKGTVQTKDLQKLFKSLGVTMKKGDLSDLMASCKISDGKPMTFQEFLQLSSERKGVTDLGHTIIDGNMHVKAATGGAKHMISLEETAAFSKHINQRLGNDPDLQHVLPLDPDSMDLYHAVNDGLLLIKMINLAEKGTIDMRAVNIPKKGKVLSIFEQRENNNIVIESAKAIGCKVIGVRSQSLIEGTRCPHLVLGLVWQVVKIELM